MRTHTLQVPILLSGLREGFGREMMEMDVRLRKMALVLDGDQSHLVFTTEHANLLSVMADEDPRLVDMANVGTGPAVLLAVRGARSRYKLTRSFRWGNESFGEICRSFILAPMSYSEQ